MPLRTALQNPVRVRLWLEAHAGSRSSTDSSRSGSGSGRRQLAQESSSGSGGRRGGRPAGHHRHRKLLDAEKLLLATDSQGHLWVEDGRTVSGSSSRQVMQWCR